MIVQRRSVRSWWLALAMLAACSHEADDATAEPKASNDVAAQVPAWPPFTVRGRWADPLSLRYRIETREGPMSQRAFADAIERAIAQWNATGCVRLSPTDAGVAEVTFGWRSGAHDECEPFGSSGAVAHAGPAGRATFVHFDASRALRPDGTGPLSLQSVALHEIGHALGLDHVEDPRAAMSTSPTRPCAVGDGDLAGLWSLYGGGIDDASDLRIADSKGSVRATLRRVAPPGISDFGWLDTDGDGRDELLAWRTDGKGHGALTIYAFTAELRLERTVGPIVGAVVPGATTRAFVTDYGERLLVSELADGRRSARSFSDTGALEPYEGATPSPPPAAQPPDFDGDGSPESVARPAR